MPGKCHLSYFEKYPWLFSTGVGAALFLLVIGLISPMMTMSKFYFFENSFSVTGGIIQLFREGQWILALLVLAFSVLLPIAKIALLFLVSNSKSAHSNTRRSKYLSLMHEYGRWAMLDVLVVAVLIVTVKLGAVASVEVHWGLYVFAASVGLIMYLTHVAVKRFDART